MRIVLAHNHYRAAAGSGEDMVFRVESGLLREAGVEVVTFERSNEGLSDDARSLAATALSGMWSRTNYIAMRKLLREVQPDLVHFHNIFPQISVSAYHACRAEGIPVVQTVHNFRVACVNGMFLREGQVCEDCLGHMPWRGVVRGCYRGSVVASSAVAGMIMTARLLRTYTRCVHRFIALNHFAAERLAASGLPADRIVVRPNTLSHSPDVGSARDGYVLFAGRHSEEKGVRTLVDAWARLPDVPLRVIGEGPLTGELKARADASRANVEFLGRRPHEEVIRLMQGAACVVVPSICYEGMPLVVVEAFATGTPVIASDIGSLVDLVQQPAHGLRFRPGDAEDLASTVRRAMSDPAWLARTGAANREHYLAHFSPAVTTESLLAIYRDAIAAAR